MDEGPKFKHDGAFYKVQPLGDNKYRVQTPYTMALMNAVELERMLTKDQQVAQRGAVELALMLRGLRAIVAKDGPAPAELPSPKPEEAETVMDALTEQEKQEPPKPSAIRKSVLPPMEPSETKAKASPAKKAPLIEKAKEVSSAHPVMLVAAEKPDSPKARAPKVPKAAAPLPAEPFTAAAPGKRPRRLSGRALLEWIRAQRDVPDDAPQAVNG